MSPKAWGRRADAVTQPWKAEPSAASMSVTQNVIPKPSLYFEFRRKAVTRTVCSVTPLLPGECLLRKVILLICVSTECSVLHS